ncbi:hypothetical protein LIER_32508 [Lithospermum erythrorhizon]|uniref:Uncharacterized protein n=1 Tax=Lithospermum erythrorhizon TaxID=34254 RepID=A0AAV3RX59_LITER
MAPRLTSTKGACGGAMAVATDSTPPRSILRRPGIASPRPATLPWRHHVRLFQTIPPAYAITPIKQQIF